MAKTKYQTDASLKMVVKMPAETCFASLRNIDQNRLADTEALSVTNLRFKGDAYEFEIRLHYGRFSVPFRGMMRENENFQTTIITGRVMRLLNMKVNIVLAFFGAFMLYYIRDFPPLILSGIILLLTMAVVSIGHGYATDARRLLTIIEGHFKMTEKLYQLQAGRT